MSKVYEHYLDQQVEYLMSGGNNHDEYMEEIYRELEEKSKKLKQEAERLREENRRLLKELNALKAKGGRSAK